MNKLITYEHKKAGWILLAIALVAYAMCFTSCASTGPYTGCYVGKKLTKVDTAREKKTAPDRIGGVQSGHINS